MTIYPPAWVLFLKDKPINIEAVLDAALGPEEYSIGRVSYFDLGWSVISYKQDLCGLRNLFPGARALRLTRTGIIMDAAGNSYGEFKAWHIGERPFPEHWFQNDDMIFKITLETV